VRVRPSSWRLEAFVPRLAAVRAIVHRRYGGLEVLALEALPSSPLGAREVRVRVEAAALNPKDVLIRKGRFRWLSGGRFPMGTGYDVAGRVAALGAGARGLALGERVMGMLDGFRGGTCAEEVVLRDDQLAPVPDAVSWLDAAALPLAASTALQALRDLAHVGGGARVLLHGASGGVGVHAIQIAKLLGAHVTTTSGAHNLARCAALGADVTLTYDDPAAPFASGARFDAIVDVYGNRSFGWARAGLAPRGVYVSTVPSRRILLDSLRSAVGRGPRARLVVVRARRRDLETLASWAASGELVAQIDVVLPFERTADGHAHLETRRATGKVVIAIGDEARREASGVSMEPSSPR
jgi:NADPH:quinone reductase-like Zn-dependent oxidoreductase